MKWVPNNYPDVSAERLTVLKLPLMTGHSLCSSPGKPRNLKSKLLLATRLPAAFRRPKRTAGQIPWAVRVAARQTCLPLFIGFGPAGSQLVK